MVCSKIKHDKDWTHLLTFSPQLSGQGTSVKQHVVSLWLSSFALLKMIPHPHTTSAIGHIALWASLSLRFTAMRQFPGKLIGDLLPNVTGMSPYTNYIDHQPYSKNCLPIGSHRRLAQGLDISRICCPGFCDLKTLTQKPQKVCPYGITNSASNNGFLL